MQRLAPVFSVLILIAVLAGPEGSPQRSAVHGVHSPPSGNRALPATRNWTGLTIIFNADDPWSVFERDLQKAEEWGASVVQVQVSYYARDHSSAGFPVFDRRTPTKKQLLHILKSVKSTGKSLVLHPVLLIQDPDSQYWRGQFEPVHEDLWWSDYSRWIGELAMVAESAETDLLFIGSELTSLQTASSRWIPLIQKTRSIFSGKIGYSANWDSWMKVPFHSELDILGLNGYFPLDLPGESAIRAVTVEDYRSRLLPHWSAMNQWKQQHETPLVFTEVGYPASAIDLSRPWDKGSLLLEQLGEKQKLGFEAFLGVFGDSGSHCGILFYALHGHDPGSPSGYTPVLKETRMMWTQLFQESMRP